MRATQHTCAASSGLAAPERLLNDEAPGETAEGFEGQGEMDCPDSRHLHHAAQAALTIEGEADAVQPGELAVLLSFLTGEMLHGACRLIEKALQGGRHE